MICKQLINQYRKEYPAIFHLNLVFGDCSIDIAANNNEIIQELDKYFKPFVQESKKTDITITFHQAAEPEIKEHFTIKKPDPGKTKIKEEYLDIDDGRIVRKRLTGMVFIFGNGEHLGIGHCLDNLNQAVNFINNRYIEWELCQGCLLGHAAAISWKDKGMAIAGFSGAGKSTLALHVMNLGATFVSNDRLMIKKEKGHLSMFGVAKQPRINPGTILNNDNLIKILNETEKQHFSSMPEKDLWNLEYKYDAIIEECFGKERFMMDSPMNALTILNWKHGNGKMDVAQVDISKRQDLLPAFMKSTGLFFNPVFECNMPIPCKENYVKYLSNCNVLEFTGGVDFEQAALICISFLEKGSL